MVDTDFERHLWRTHDFVCGVDEAGRGPLAGPVVAAAVVFPKGFSPNGILKNVTDSKKLSISERASLEVAIKESAYGFSVKSVTHEVIDSINILNATFQAMNEAIASLSPLPSYLLIDGNRFSPALPLPFETVVKGDSRVYSIAAASILAKTARDRIMKEFDQLYPGYGFAHHYGYATSEHINAIRKLGRSQIHRKTFLLKALGEKG
ncbi:MAG: ribonuclease HII [Chloroherpetonaceae bacterium]|nr:ribonuclease HII [Chloroherpetonaceae bacterium]